MLFNFHGIEETRQVQERLNRCDKKRYKRKKVRGKLNIGEKVLVLGERIKKNLHQESFISNRYKILPILTETRHFQPEKDKISIKLITTGSEM